MSVTDLPVLSEETNVFGHVVRSKRKSTEIVLKPIKARVLTSKVRTNTTILTQCQRK